VLCTRGGRCKPAPVSRIAETIKPKPLSEPIDIETEVFPLPNGNAYLVNKPQRDNCKYAEAPPRLGNYLTYHASQSATVPIRAGPCETAIRQANEMQKTMALALLLACGSAQAESIPFISEHATFVVRVVINDRITLNFTIDSGASDLSIPADVFSTLTRAGCDND
jgi:hypothetical protein